MRIHAHITGAAVLVTAAVLAAGCGGGSNAVKGAQVTKQSAKAQVLQVWTAFFSGTTPAQRKIKLLQNGQQFAPLIKAESQSPLAHQTKVTVRKVTFVSPTRAKVVYTILLSGKPALKNQIGYAIRVGNSWKVADQSFCALLSLQGTAPALCKH